MGKRLRLENTANQATAQLDLFEYSEGWYNPHRRHSALDYRSPVNERSLALS